MHDLLSLDQLKAMEDPLTTPFELDVPGRERLICEEVFRHLPGKRIVFRSIWGGAEVLVKLFFRKKDLVIEQAGLDAIHDSGVPCPKKIWGLIDKGGGYFIATEFLQDAQTLSSCYQNFTKKKLTPLLQDAVKIIGLLHANGWMQKDIHLDNFMLSQDKIYMIDGGGIRNLKNPVENLALFFAQMIPDYDSIAASIVPSYRENLPPIDDFSYTIRIMRELRIKRFLSKSMRSCTKFKVLKTKDFFIALTRKFLTKELSQLVNEPEITIGQAKFLKRGNTATVVKVHNKDSDWTIKRYNIKDFRHRFSRCWRPSRACVSWQGAHRLALLGIATPQPIAMRENRSGRFRKEAYLVTEYIEGKNLQSWLLSLSKNQVPNWLGKEVLRLFDILWHSKVSHGDMKASNFIVSENILYMIDLDTLQWHSSEESMNQAFTRDIERFMENWQGNTWVYFKDILSPLAEQLNITLKNKKV
jgi:tRNA A-37 threonylcarbamoyl transferase component Bud32